MTNERKQGRDGDRPKGAGSTGGAPESEGLELRRAGGAIPDPDGLRSDGGRAGHAAPDGVEGPEREAGAVKSGGAEAREPRDATSTEDHLETRMPLEAGEGPRAPTGDALLDDSGTRHGVDDRDERPTGG